MKTMRPSWQRLLTTIALAAAWLATSERISGQRAAAEDVRLGSLKTLEGSFPFVPPSDAAAWLARRETVRRRVQVSLGLWPPPARTPLEPVMHGRLDRGDHTVERVSFQSLPGLFVTGNLYRPKQVAGSVPGVLFAHGHWRDARLSEEPADQLRAEIASGGERFEQGGRSRFQSLCVQAARMGCVVWQWDMLGESDCLQFSRDLIHGFAVQRPEFNDPDGWGLFSPRAEARLQSAMGLQAWNSIRSLDFLRSLPEVDPERIAMTGASGGGTQTMILAAVDDRLALSYPVVMVSTGMQGGCTCENACLLRIDTGNVEFAALFAPKPLGMNTADDWTRDLATDGFPELQRLYGLLGAGDAVALQRGEHFPHNYNAVSRSGFFTFLNRHFRLGFPEPVIERDYQPLSRSELSVWDDAHPAPPAADPDFEKRLLVELAADTDALVGAAAATAQGMREVIRPALEVLVGRTLADAGRTAWEETARSQDRGPLRIEGIVRNVTHREEVRAAILAPATRTGGVVLWLGDRGLRSLTDDDGQPEPAVSRLLAAGSVVVGLDLFRQSENPPARNRTVDNPRESAAYTYGYNHPLLAQRAHDLLTVVAWLQGGLPADLGRPERIGLAAFGSAAPVAAAARAVAGDAIDRTALDSGGFRFAELTDWRDARFLPGGARYLDLPGFLAAWPTPLWLAGEPDPTPPQAAAFQAFGDDRWLERFSGSSEQAPLAAAAWLVRAPRLAGPPVEASTRRLPRIRPAADGHGFETDHGQPFVPFGVNYFRSGQGWAPQFWKQFDAEATRRDFTLMKGLGVNCVRVFVTYGSFLTEPDRVAPEGLAKFDRFLELAEEAGIYVHPTGPDHWEGVPAWAQGDRIVDEQVLAALENFWRTFAARYRDRSVIFAYDLLNEPEVGWDTPAMHEPWNRWLEARYTDDVRLEAAWGPGDWPGLGSIPAPPKEDRPGCPRMLDYQRFREDLADAWTRRQVAAIKAADPQALVTVGLIQWSVPAVLGGGWMYSGFRPERQAPLLDFMEIHFYPLANGHYAYDSDDEEKNLAYLECVIRGVARFGKPVVIAEYGWYGGGTLTYGSHPPATEQQQAEWCQRLVDSTAGHAHGWLHWGLFDQPEATDVSQLIGLVKPDGTRKAWAGEFAALAAAYSGRRLPEVSTGPRPEMDFDQCITSAKKASRFRARYLEAWRAERDPSAVTDRGAPRPAPRP